MKAFYLILLNTLIATVTNNFLWFALTFWVYLETRSVIASSIVGASFPLLTSISSLYFGTFIDHHRKKTAMLLSSVLSFGAFSLAGLVYVISDPSTLLALTNPLFWMFIVLVMAGAVAGNLRMITISTLVTLLVPEKDHDRANGLVGMVNGVSFAITSVFSGLAIAFLGMGWCLVFGSLITLVVLVHMYTINFKDTKDMSHEEKKKRIDIAGALAAARAIPGLIGLIFFSMINNFLGGAYFALMDPYGLELVSVEVWGFIWGGLSVAFILGGMLVAKIGLGSRPLRTMFVCNIAMWIIGLLFPLQASIYFVVVGMFAYMLLVPAVEAAEQTVLQKVVPLKKQGRVFGLAQTAEMLVSPVMALMIGPLTQIYFIPFMTTGSGVDLIGSWFGTGVNRGMALVFIVASLIGLMVTLAAIVSKPYRLLSKAYAQVPQKT